MTKLKPMLAAKYEEARVFNQLPVYVQPKYDGIRAMLYKGQLLSRSFKPIPNMHIRKVMEAASPMLSNIDGELIIGSPTDPDVYRNTNSAVMSHGGEPDFRFFAFDYAVMNYTFEERNKHVVRDCMNLGTSLPWLKVTPSVLAHTIDQIMEAERVFVSMGYEGVVLRGPSTGYKFGRATPAQGQLIKLKRYIDSEAVVTGFEELMHNDNEAFLDELGYMARSAHQANKRPGNTLGKLVAKAVLPDLSEFGLGHLTGNEVEIRAGSGFTQAERKDIWDNQDKYLGKTFKYKFFPVGMKEKPRHPIWLGWRHEDDM